MITGSHHVKEYNGFKFVLAGNPLTAVQIQELLHRIKQHRFVSPDAVGSRTQQDIIEPYLIQQGFLQRTPRGRVLTANAFKHLGLAEPKRELPQFGLFADEA